MIIIFIVIGLFALEIILPTSLSGLFKSKNNAPPIFRDPGLAHKYYERAFKLQEARQWNEAIEQYNDAIKFDSKQAGYFNNRGLCYFFLNDFESACRDFSNAIALDNSNTTYFENRGQSYLMIDKKFNGISDLKKAITLGSKDAAGFIKEYEQQEHIKALREKLDKQDDLPF
jgi:tetratricopeptide (TPR) repeat protein